jgi:fructose-1,6-bisphosphatase/inositol monophosphatase family enzyme
MGTPSETRGSDSPWVTGGLLLAPSTRSTSADTILRQGRSHIGALVAGDRDFATDVELHVESAVKTSLGEATPEIPFLGEEQGKGLADHEPHWVLNPINDTRTAVAKVDELREAVVGLADFKVGIGSEEENRIHVGLLRRFARECLGVRMHGSAALLPRLAGRWAPAYHRDALEPALGRDRGAVE